MADWRGLERFAFGGGDSVLADELAALVLAGVKCATCWAAAEGAVTELGKHMVMVDSAGRPLAVIETTELTRRRFGDVDADFAYDEGEDDRSLDSWRRAHRCYFTRRGQFTEDMWLYCERFRVVARISEDADD
jgi:uncharacterized protein YhfF